MGGFSLCNEGWVEVEEENITKQLTKLTKLLYCYKKGNIGISVFLFMWQQLATSPSWKFQFNKDQIQLISIQKDATLWYPRFSRTYLANNNMFFIYLETSLLHMHNYMPHTFTHAIKFEIVYDSNIFMSNVCGIKVRFCQRRRLVC